MNLLLITNDQEAKSRIISLLEKSFPGWKILDEIQTESAFKSRLKDLELFDFIIGDMDLLNNWKSLDELKSQDEIPLVFMADSDQFAIQAFDYNCLDYLIKPIQEKKALRAFQKVSKFLSAKTSQKIDNQLIERIMESYSNESYKKRFLVKIGNRFTFVPTEKVSFFYSENGVTYMVESNSSQKYIVENSLNELQDKLLDPSRFYRVNRSMIINLDDVSTIKPYVNGRLILSLNTKSDYEPIVARERVSEFKSWINQ